MLFSKTKGIRPLGISDIFRRFLAKLIVLKAGPYATNVCGADQLCAGLRAGVKGTIHRISALWNEVVSDDTKKPISRLK